MRTVDIHAHWYPEEWLALFAKDGAREGASLERKAGGGFMLRAKHITNACDERFVVVDERVKAMDERKIDVHALSLTTPMVYWASGALGLALSQAFNDAAKEAKFEAARKTLRQAAKDLASAKDVWEKNAQSDLDELTASLPGYMRRLELAIDDLIVGNPELSSRLRDALPSVQDLLGGVVGIAESQQDMRQMSEDAKVCNAASFLLARSKRGLDWRASTTSSSTSALWIVSWRSN